jgi:hypothetical protein
MVPAPGRAAEWVDVRPLRRTHAPTPGASNPATRPRQATTPAGFPRLRSSATARARQARSSSPAPRRALTAPGAELDPPPRGGTEPAAARKPSTTANPGPLPGHRSGQHALLTAKAPMGGCSALLGSWPMVHLRQPRQVVATCSAAAICTSCLYSAAGHRQAPSPAVLALSRRFALPVLTPGHPAAAHRSRR